MAGIDLEGDAQRRLLEAMSQSPEMMGQQDQVLLPGMMPKGTPMRQLRPVKPQASPIASLKAQLQKQNAERDARIMAALRGSAVLGSTSGLVPVSKLPERFRTLRGPQGELPYGLAAHELDPDDLMYMGFSREDALKLGRQANPPTSGSR